jgi:hypothetical protein
MSMLQELIDFGQPEGLNYSSFRVAGRRVLDPNNMRQLLNEVRDSVAELDEVLGADKDARQTTSSADPGVPTISPVMTHRRVDELIPPILIMRSVSSSEYRPLDHETIFRLARETLWDSGTASGRVQLGRHCLRGIQGAERRYRSELNRLAAVQSARLYVQQPTIDPEKPNKS